MQIGGLCAFFTVLGIGAAASEPTMGDTSNQTAADAAGWLFPVEHVNRALPHWIRFGGEYRLRLESEDGIGFTTTRDVYLLSRFRFNVNIKPTQWLTFFGETQDARVFFSHHVPTGPTFQNSWDVRQAYVQLGSATGAWSILSREPHWSPTCCGALPRQTMSSRQVASRAPSVRSRPACAWLAPCRVVSITTSKWTNKPARLAPAASTHGLDIGISGR